MKPQGPCKGCEDRNVFYIHGRALEEVNKLIN